MIECRGCKKMISIFALSCPTCGANLSYKKCKECTYFGGPYNCCKKATESMTDPEKPACPGFQERRR